jgi:hypothetical protein
MNETAPPETAQYAFLIGDWDVDVLYRSPNGQEVEYAARWHNTWIVDGHVVMQEWRGPYATGAELRVYNPATQMWEGRNVYAGRQNWTSSTARFEDGRMIVETESAANLPRAFINREVYHDIMADSFKMYAERSYDGGETWERTAGTYEMVCTRRDG